MDAILDSLQPLQLPPLQLGQLDNQFRDRPLPLEPAARQDLFTTSPTSQYGERQQASQPPHPSTSQQIPVANRTLTSTADTQEQIKPSVNNETQKDIIIEAAGTSSESLGTKNQPSIHTLIPQDHNATGSVRKMANSSSKPNSPDNTAHSMPRLYPPILPWIDDVDQKPERLVKSQSSPAQQQSAKSGKTRRKWTAEETRDLLQGCAIHGVGNWKKVLDDPNFNFNNRSSVDLKDRFRTCFPAEYKNHLGKKTPGSNDTENVSVFSNILTDSRESPSKSSETKYQRKNAKKRNTESPVSILEKYGCPNSFPKAQRRERKPFTPEEDEALLRGFEIHGALWSKIQGDKSLNLSHRRSTDLRDRFRNAYPRRYEQAGFKARSKHPPKPPRSGPCSVEGGASSGDTTTGSNDCAMRTENLTSPNMIDTEQADGSISPLDVDENDHSYDTQDIADHLDDFDLENLGKSTTLDIDDRGDLEDDELRKHDNFNVTTMMQDLLRDSSLREWEDSNDHMTTDSSSLFSTANHNESPLSTSPVTTDSTLAEEFCSNGLAQFDEQSFLNTAAATSNMNNSGNRSTPGDSSTGGSSTHDLVRWEDMVTHPIFVLDVSIPGPPPSSSPHHLSQHLHHNHPLPGLDEVVTLAPINPQLFGGRAPQGPADLPSFTVSNSLTSSLNLGGFDDGVIEAVSAGNLTSVSDLLQQHDDHSALTSLELPPLDEHVMVTNMTKNGKKRRKGTGQTKSKMVEGKENGFTGASIMRVTSTMDDCENQKTNSKSKKRRLGKMPALISPSVSPALSDISSST